MGTLASNQTLTVTVSWKTAYITKFVEFPNLYFLLWPKDGCYGPRLVAKIRI